MAVGERSSAWKSKLPDNRELVGAGRVLQRVSAHAHHALRLFRHHVAKSPSGYRLGSPRHRRCFPVQETGDLVIYRCSNGILLASMAARSRLPTVLAHGELRIETDALLRSMSVAGEIALGVVCCCGFALSALLLLYAGNPWIDHKAIPIFGSRLADTILFGAAGLICAFVTTRLIQCRRWAWWTAFGVSLLILGLGIFVCCSALNPHSDFARSESGFGIGISIILMTPSFISTLLLLLPVCDKDFRWATSLLNWRNTPITLNDQRSKREIAWFHQLATSDIWVEFQTSDPFTIVTHDCV